MFGQGEANTPIMSPNGELNDVMPIHRNNSFADNYGADVNNNVTNAYQNHLPLIVPSMDTIPSPFTSSYTSNAMYNQFMVQSINTDGGQPDLSDNPADNTVPSSLSTSTNSQYDGTTFEDILIVAHPSRDDVSSPDDYQSPSESSFVGNSALSLPTSETKSIPLNLMCDEACEVEPRLRSLQCLAPLRHCKPEEKTEKTGQNRKKRSNIPPKVKIVALYLYELYVKEYSNASIRDIAETIQIDYLAPWLQYEKDSSVIRQFIYNTVPYRTRKYKARDL